MSSSAAPKVDLFSIVGTAVSNMLNLDSIYLKADISKKREIIGSIFHEKLCFDGTPHRTGQLNDAVSFICLINKKLKVKKNGAKSISKTLPHKG